MKSYNKKGLYNSYDKNHKERNNLDFYSTPTEEVVNILETMNLDLTNMIILEPCCGDGAMIKGIFDYMNKHPENYPDAIAATDIKERQTDKYQFIHEAGEEYDFLSDNYKVPGDLDIDYIIMNPPYSTIEPFVIRALEIANRGVLMLGRLQFLEGKSRYENILKDNPPTDIYIYVDRIKCYKNGDINDNTSSAQAYAWFFWDKEHVCNHVIQMNKVELTNIAIGYVPDEKTSRNTTAPLVHWIRRVN